MKKFLAGMIVGAAVAAVLTPKTGRDLQDELIEKANKLQKKVKDFDLKECVSNIELDLSKETLQMKLEEAKQAVEDFDWDHSKEKVAKKFDEVTERLNEIKEQLIVKEEDYL